MSNGDRLKATIEAVADAIDEARYRHPDYPRARPRPFSEADRSDREYAIRLACAAIRATEVERLRAALKEIASGSIIQGMTPMFFAERVLQQQPREQK